MAFLLFKTDVGDVVKRESDIFASKSSVVGMQRQITNEIDDTTRHNLLIRRLEERYGPLIAQCQEASSLSQRLNLKGELPIRRPKLSAKLVLNIQ